MRPLLRRDDRADGFARKEKKEGIIYVRERVCVGIWVSALVHERGGGPKPVGVGADLEYPRRDRPRGALTLLGSECGTARPVIPLGLQTSGTT